MSFWSRFREPQPCDYDSEEEYQEALEAYEYAESRALDDARERYYEGRQLA